MEASGMDEGLPEVVQTLRNDLDVALGALAATRLRLETLSGRLLAERLGKATQEETDHCLADLRDGLGPIP